METVNNKNVPCPVCSGAAICYTSLSSQFLHSALERFIRVPLPQDLTIPSYEMRRCNVCALEFAHPPAPATDAFYNWLDQRGDYYIKKRWEWDQVSDLVQGQEKSGKISSILEIGAGDAYFLNKLRAFTGARVVAIERSPQAVSALREKGTEAYVQNADPHPLAGQVFDFALSFHCLEHVTDPVAFLRDLCSWAGSKGRVLFSVPYSPMYFESLWFDPLNHPPHHMSRWNKRSLSKLAECVGGRVHLRMPKAYSVIARTRYSLAIHYLGAHWHGHRLAKFIPLLHPIHFLTELFHQLRREQVNAQAAADVVLVEIIRD